MQDPRGASGDGGPKLRWDDARVLLALLETRSLTKAGARLGIDASTVSRRLDALERALRARLFDRTPDGVAPTALAETLGPHAQAMERAASGLVLAAEGRESAPEGEVTLSAPPGYAEYFVAPLLHRLHAKHPGLRLVLDANTAMVDLPRHEADLALRSARPTAGDLVSRKLGTVALAVLASPRYAAELGELRSAADARWINWGPDLAHILQAGFVASAVPDAAVVLRTSHLGSQIAAAESGLGVMLGNATLARMRKLAVVPLAGALKKAMPQTGGDMWLVGHRALREVPRVAAVWDFIVAEARRLGMEAGMEARS